MLDLAILASVTGLIAWIRSALRRMNKYERDEAYLVVAGLCVGFSVLAVIGLFFAVLFGFV